MRTLYRDGALADGRSDRLELGVSILVEDGRISWIRPSDDAGPTDSGDVPESALEVAQIGQLVVDVQRVVGDGVHRPVPGAFDGRLPGRPDDDVVQLDAG